MSIQLVLADALLRLTAKRRFRRKPDLLELRALMAGGRVPRAPSHIELRNTSLGGVPAEELVPKGAAADRAVLYIHGGGWVAGSPATHRALTWRIAEKLGCRVFALDYRLAPEHPFPAGLEDCVAAWRALIDRGYDARLLAIGGDSAGGNLTLALALKLKALGIALPGALFALSAATDLAARPQSHFGNRLSDAIFDPRMFDSVGKHYFPGGDATDPFLSPLRGEFSGLPPTLIQCSREEMLRDDSVLLAEKLESAGVEVKLEVWPRVFHAWQIMADLLPEARKAIDGIAAFVSRQWDRQPAAVSAKTVNAA
ncbi:MAG: alpha/beta hydrolase [Alphaproteobacteria bacterium]|nr:alpha/beta hydrolase [Alphaproteobacteria bacterium]